MFRSFSPRRTSATAIRATPATCSDRSRIFSPNLAPNLSPTWAAANAWIAIQTTVRAMGRPSSPALKPTVSSSTLMLRPRSRMARPRAWASRRRRLLLLRVVLARPKEEEPCDEEEHDPAVAGTGADQVAGNPPDEDAGDGHA